MTKKDPREMTDLELEIAFCSGDVFDPSFCGFVPTHLLVDYCRDDTSPEFERLREQYMENLISAALKIEAECSPYWREMQRRVYVQMAEIEKTIHNALGGKLQ